MSESEKPKEMRTVAEQMAIARAARKPGNFARSSAAMRAAAMKRWDAERAKKEVAQNAGSK